MSSHFCSDQLQFGPAIFLNVDKKIKVTDIEKKYFHCGWKKGVQFSFNWTSGSEIFNPSQYRFLKIQNSIILT